MAISFVTLVLQKNVIQLQLGGLKIFLATVSQHYISVQLLYKQFILKIMFKNKTLI